MSLEANKNVVSRFNMDFISTGNRAAFEELLSSEFVDHNAIPGFPPGAEGAWQLLNGMYRSAFPDLVVEIHDQVAEGDQVATRKTFHGTHKGSLMGIPPTGKRVQIGVIDIVRIANGQIVEHWNVVDTLGLLQQVGAVPAPQAA